MAEKKLDNNVGRDLDTEHRRKTPAWLPVSAGRGRLPSSGTTVAAIASRFRKYGSATAFAAHNAGGSAASGPP